jgi:ferredoxin-NADP reductase
MLTQDQERLIDSTAPLVAEHCPGQYIGVRLIIGGEPVYRHYEHFGPSRPLEAA